MSEQITDEFGYEEGEEFADGIVFFDEDAGFVPEQADELRAWLQLPVQDRGMEIDSISYIFCSDEYLLQINMEYLSHDTYTDIITFGYQEGGEPISADIFVSIERVRENSNTFGTSFRDELHRVMIHGILHLTGMEDETDEQEQQMRAQEQHYLSLRTF